MKLMCYSSCDYDEIPTEMTFTNVFKNDYPTFHSDFKNLVDKVGTNISQEGEGAT